MPVVDEIEQNIAAANGSSEPVWRWLTDGAPYVDDATFREQLIGWLGEHGLDAWAVRDLHIVVDRRSDRMMLRVIVSERDELGRPSGRFLHHTTELLSSPPEPPKEQQP